MVTAAGPPALILIPSVADCGATSIRLVLTAPGLIVTEVGVSASVVLALKVSELTLKFCSKVVATAALVGASHWNTTSVPAPGIVRAGIVPARSWDQLFKEAFQVVSVSPRQ